MQAYQGYFENGRFISFDGNTIPDCKLAIVTVVSEPKSRMSIWNDFFQAIQASDENVHDFERIDLSRDIDL
jgi:hypothetical protein